MFPRTRARVRVSFKMINNKMVDYSTETSNNTFLQKTKPGVVDILWC